MKKHALPLLLATILLTVSSSLFAEEEQTYGRKVGNKALNGFANMTTAVLEIPKSIINTTNDSNLAWGAVGGLMKGIINSVGRIFVGTIDLVTAPLPTKTYVYPAYVWDDFDEDTTYGKVFRLQE